MPMYYQVCVLSDSGREWEIGLPYVCKKDALALMQRHNEWHRAGRPGFIRGMYYIKKFQGVYVLHR